jgi:hypothetical protein
MTWRKMEVVHRVIVVAHTGRRNDASGTRRTTLAAKREKREELITPK